MKFCCDRASQEIIGTPCNWRLNTRSTDSNTAFIDFCPFCGTKLQNYINKFEVVVSFSRGLGPESKKIKIEAATIAEAKAKAEKEVDETTAKYNNASFKIVEIEVTPLKD